MKKRFIAAIVTATLALGVLTACGGSDDGAASAESGAASTEAEGTEENAPAQDEAPAQEDAAPAEETADDEAAGETAVESKGTITVAEVTVFNDYVQPNQVVESGEFDANYFQHIPYLDSFNEEQGTHLVNAGGIHYEPFGIYPGTKSDLTTLEKGDVIAVPNDTTNEARALLLLQDNGMITLKDGVGLEATVRDIVDNPNEIEIQELEAAQVPRVKDEVAFVVLNGNYALEAGFSVAKDAVAYEQADSEAAKTYVNVIAVKEGNENNEAVKALVDVLLSDEITEYINNTYDGGVIPFK